jgi:hypothetical protein
METKYRNIEHDKLLTIGSNYNYAIKRIRELTRLKPISPSEREIKRKYTNYVISVGKTILKFNELEKEFLQNEYFIPLPKGWWESIYPRSTYYRIRLNVARKFLFYISML